MNQNNKMEKIPGLAHFTIQQALDAIFWVDSNSGIHKANEAACRLTGFPMEELLNRKIYEINPALDKHSWSKEWKMLKKIKDIQKKLSYVEKTVPWFLLS